MQKGRVITKNRPCNGSKTIGAAGPRILSAPFLYHGQRYLSNRTRAEALDVALGFMPPAASSPSSPADRRAHAFDDHDMRQRPVVGAAVVLQPRGLVRVLVQVLRADVVMLALHHAAQAGEVAFRHVGVLAVVAVDLAMVHAVTRPSRRAACPSGDASSAMMVAMRSTFSRTSATPAPSVLATNGSGAALALAQGDHDAALAGLVLAQAAVLAVFLAVLRADVTAEIGAVDLDVAVQDVAGLDLLRHRLAQLVGQDEGGLVLAIQIAAELHHADALGGVHDDADRGQQVHEVHLAAGEDRAAGDAELVVARLALELAAGGDVVGFVMQPQRGHTGLAIGFGPAHLAERLVSRFLARLVDRAKAEGAGRCGKKEVLGHCTVSDAYASNIVH